MSPLKLLRIYGPRRHGLVAYCFVLLGLSVTLVTVDLIIPLFSKVLFDFAYTKQSFAILNIVAIASFCFYCLHFLLKSCYEFLEQYATQRLAFRMRNQLFSHIQKLQLSVLRSHAKGDLIIRLTDDVDKCQDVIFNQRIDLFTQICQLVGILGLCFWINLQASMLIASSLPIYLFLSRYLFKTELGIIRDKLIAQRVKLIEYLQLKLRQTSVTKTFHQEGTEELYYEQLNRTQFSLKINDRIVRTLFSINSTLGFDTWNVLITWYLGFKIARGSLTIGDVVSLLLLFNQLKVPLHGLTLQFGRYRNAMASLRRIHEILIQPTEIETAQPARELKKLENLIEFKKVKFGYDPESRVFEELSFTIPANQYVFLIGQNGAGKSTVVQLLQRYYEPNTGEILLDGIDYRSFSLESLRRSIIHVSLDHTIFPGTIRENITYGKREASEEEIYLAAQEALSWEFIQFLPQKLDTLLKNEEELSSSQRHRLAITRALLLNPRILIIDEIFSELDLVSDYYIQEAIQRIAKGRTVIVIGQRASAVRNAGRILFLKDGSVTENGTFNDLMEKKGDFFSYYTLQHSNLGEFKGMLDYEMQRCARHGSVFTVACFKIIKFEVMKLSESALFLAKLTAEIRIVLAKSLRQGDCITEFQNGTFLFLLPQLTEGQVGPFLSRMEGILDHQVYSIDGKSMQLEFLKQTLTFTEGHQLPNSSEQLISLITQMDSWAYEYKKVS